MSTAPSVIVNKGGFFSSLFRGIFGTIITLIICASTLGLYGIHTASKKVDMAVHTVTELVPAIAEAAKDWQEALPPQIADALNDRRAFDYRESLDISTRYIHTRDYHDRVVVAIANEGEEAVSLLSMRLVVEDESESPVLTEAFTAALPIQIDDCDDWPGGPILPGETREIVLHVSEVEGDVQLRTEVSDLRVWNGPVQHNQESDALVANSD